MSTTDPASLTWPRFPSLHDGELAPIIADLKERGWKPPAVGRALRLDDGRELCRDARGFYLVGTKRPVRQALDSDGFNLDDPRRQPTAGGDCPRCGAPHHGTRDSLCDHL